jgi:hypothetical protein
MLLRMMDIQPSVFVQLVSEYDPFDVSDVDF